MDLETLYQENLRLLRDSGADYREIEHEPVLTYEQAEDVRKRFGLTGVESKSLFLRLKDGRYCMLISVEGKRFDSKRFKELLGSKPSICSDQELVERTACIPRGACPFGHSSDILLVIDKEIFKHQRFIYSPGPPERTVEVATSDVRKILESSPNEVIYYNV